MNKQQFQKEIKKWEKEHGEYDHLTGVPLKLKKDAKIPVIPKWLKS